MVDGTSQPEQIDKMSFGANLQNMFEHNNLPSLLHAQHNSSYLNIFSGL